MGISVLLVSTTTRWFGTARMPRAFAHAGFDVALLAPKDSLAEKSRFVGRVGHLPDNATPRDWIYAFAATVKATAPRIVVPCNDMSLRLLDRLAQAPPDDMASELKLQLGELIRESLGDPRFYGTSIDTTLLPPAARALGVRVPEHAIVADFAAADAFASAHGYPVVVKRSSAPASDFVAVGTNRDSLRRAFGAPATTGPTDRAAAGTWLVQQHVRGRICRENVAAWQGKRLAGFAVERLAGDDEAKGPATVIRWFHSPGLRDISERLVSGFGMSGLFEIECVVDERTGDAYLTEVNRRLTSAMHIGERIDVDLCAALHAALTGTASTSRSDPAPGEEGIAVYFPQEWLRDPESAYLRDHPVDIPWDDPDLLDAMVAMRKE